jgi:hypothetical protein
MAALWFLHKALEPMRGFPAYQLSIQSVIAKLGHDLDLRPLSHRISTRRQGRQLQGT